MAGKSSSESVTPESKASRATQEDRLRANSIERHALNHIESTPEVRHTRIAVVAYRLAESRGFVPGGELEDWLRAEVEVDEKSPTQAGK